MTASEKYSVLAPSEALGHCLKGALLLDIRPDAITWFKGFDVPEVIYCLWRDLTDHLDKLPKDREIIVADSNGVHARKAVTLLTEKGFSQTGILAGGMVEWERDGLPVLLDQKARLSGSCMCQLKFRQPLND